MCVLVRLINDGGAFEWDWFWKERKRVCVKEGKKA